MRLPFGLPSKLQAFSEEFMSAFEPEADHLLPVSSRPEVQERSDTEMAVQPASSAIETKSIASAAIEAAGFIASSFRAIVPVPMPSRDKQSHLPPPVSSDAHADEVLEVSDSLHCRNVQESVDLELATFSSSMGSLPLSKGLTDMLHHNYMRVSFALLLLGLILLYFM